MGECRSSTYAHTSLRPSSLVRARLEVWTKRTFMNAVFLWKCHNVLNLELLYTNVQTDTVQRMRCELKYVAYSAAKYGPCIREEVALVTKGKGYMTFLSC